MGGSGVLQTAFFDLLPGVADKVIRKMFYATALDQDRPPRRRRGGFHRPGDGGHQFGEGDTYRRSMSLYDTARPHPAATLGLAAAAASVAVAAYSRSRH